MDHNQKLSQWLKALFPLFQNLRAEAGQGLVEYGLLIFLASIIVLAILLLLGPQTGSIFSVISTAI